MTHLFKLTLVLVLTLICALPSLSFATCETDLLAYFNKENVDLDVKQPMITDQVPMTSEALLTAYPLGIFPWSMTPEGNAMWFVLRDRGIMEFADYKVTASDRRAIQKLAGGAEAPNVFDRLSDPNEGLTEGKPFVIGKYTVTFDKAFRQVMEECQKQDRGFMKNEDGSIKIDPRTGEPKRNQNWITDTHIIEYSKLNEQGKAHSIEVWEGNDLVGGLYGVFIGGYYSGESMFHKRNDVVKLAYVVQAARLMANGHKFMDTQMNLGLTEKYGGKEVPRVDFEKRIQDAKIANRPY